MPTLFTVIAYWSWAVLYLVWFVGYFSRKSRASTSNIALQIPSTVLIVLCFTLLFNPRSTLPHQLTPQIPIFSVIGLVLDLAGVAFAIWARLTIGSNWSGLVLEVKEGHELVQTGPYALVRHPIYTGFVFATFGTAMTLGTAASYVGFLAGLLGFLVRIHVEEGLMATQFGDTHVQYRKRTKRLIPWIW
jgi:protein-S-isoprenylcysteine O-methyltransferase Ste14